MFHTLRSHRLAIVLILWLAFFLRLYQLDSQSLRGDEAATVFYAAFPVSELWELSRVTDPHPPLYYLMLHPWQWLVGEGAWVMRFAGVGASLLAVAVLYTLAQRTLRATTISLLAAGLLAVNPFQIWLAQDIRSYPFFTLLGLLSSGALWLAVSNQFTLHNTPPAHRAGAHKRHATRRQGHAARGTQASDTQHATRHLPCGSSLPASRFSLLASHLILWLTYIFLTVACFYIHYYTVFLIAGQGLFVLFNSQKFWDKKWLWLASQLAIGLMIIPGLGLAYNFMGQAAGGIDTIPTTVILRRASTALLTGFTIDDTWGLWISLLLAPVWLVGLVTLGRRDFSTGSFWALFFAIPVLGVIAFSINRPLFKERFLVQAQPALELLLAAGFLTIAGRRMANGEYPTGHRSANGEPIAQVSVSQRGSDIINNKSTDNIQHPTRNTQHATRNTQHATRLTASLLLAALLYANTLALNNYFTDPAYAKAPPWHLYRDYVSSEARPGDVMLTNFPEAAVSYYSPNDLPFYVVPEERDRSVEFRLEKTAQIAGAYRRLWFLPLLRQGFDEQGDVLNWLDRHADRVDQVFFPVYHVNLYLSPPTIETMMISQPVRFAHGLHLRGYQIFDKAGHSRIQGVGESLVLLLEPGDEFSLSLYWLASGPTASPYTVFTHLIAADGFNRTSQDNQPVGGSYPTTAWQPDEKITDKYRLTIPVGTPPGDHRLRVGWYQSDTQERVPILDETGQPVADYVMLDVIIRVE